MGEEPTVSAEKVKEKEKIYLLFRIIGRIGEYPWVEASQFAVGAHEHQPILHGVDELVVQHGLPLLLEQLTSAVRVHCVGWELSVVAVSDIVVKVVGEL
jgi:hypothetical protein